MTDIKEVTKDVTDIPSRARLPTTFGDFVIRVFHEEATGFDHVALDVIHLFRYLICQFSGRCQNQGL